LLYHKDKVEGQAVCQLCVPVSRRNAVLNSAHNSVYGSHMGEKKTCQRIKLSFCWPRLKRSVKDYVGSCPDCQLRAIKCVINYLTGAYATFISHLYIHIYYMV